MMYMYLYPDRVEGVRVRRQGVGGWGVVSERWRQWQWWESSHAVLPALLLPPLQTESPAAAAHTHTHTVVILNQTHILKLQMWVEETLQGFIDMNRSTKCVHEMQNTQQSERGVPTVFPL